MEKRQYNLCVEVLRRFHRHRLLNEIILIGSWSMFFYDKYFADPDYAGTVSLLTRDIDFLIDHPREMKARVNVPEILEDLGFIMTFKGTQGYIKLDHPELILEFLTPERGRGVNAPVDLPTLGVNATALRFLNYLTEKTIKVKIEDMTVRLPHPAYFALHKLLIAPRRAKKEKGFKDVDAARVVLRALIKNNHKRAIKQAFQSAPKKWQNKILESSHALEDQEVMDMLTAAS